MWEKVRREAKHTDDCKSDQIPKATVRISLESQLFFCEEIVTPNSFGLQISSMLN